MKQKIIICGAGRVGLSITEHLSNEGFDITVIDSNLEAIQKVTELYDVQGVLIHFFLKPKLSRYCF